MNKGAGRRRWPSLLAAGAIALAASGSNAQEWDARVGVSWAFQNEDGNADAFASQWNLDEGFALDDFHLAYRDGSGTKDKFLLSAFGFGGAEPAQQARLFLAPGAGWKAEVGYSRRESSFAVSDPAVSRARDSWDLTRWKGKLTWDGLKAVRLGILFRQVERDGDTQRTVWGLNEIYPLGVEMESRLTEGALRVETLTLPVRLAFEQALSRTVREERWYALDGGSAVGVSDPDRLTEPKSDWREERDVPTSRLTASWATERFEVAASGLYSRSDLDGSGASGLGFDVDEGRAGKLSFVDDLAASATQDSLAGTLRASARLGAGFTLRLLGDYRDATTDAALLGARLLRATDPRGNVFEFSTPVDEASYVDVRDAYGRLELAKDFGAVTLWAGGLAASRDAAWRRQRQDPATDASRTSGGGLAGLSLELGDPLSLDVEYEHGSFSKYVFRTDADTVDRVSGRLASRPGAGFALALTGRWEKATNDVPGAGLSNETSALGASAGWSSEDGRNGLFLEAEAFDVSNAVGTVLPTGQPSTLLYDLRLLRLGGDLRLGVGPVFAEAGAFWTEDRGDSQPLKSTVATARVGVDLPANLRLSLFGQYYRYDEERSDLDDYEVTRGGVALHWSLR